MSLSLNSSLENFKDALTWNKNAGEIEQLPDPVIELVRQPLAQITDLIVEKAVLKDGRQRASMNACFKDVALDECIIIIGKFADTAERQNPGVKIKRTLFMGEVPSEMTRPSGRGLREETADARALAGRIAAMVSNPQYKLVTDLLPDLEAKVSAAETALSALEAADRTAEELRARELQLKEAALIAEKKFRAELTLLFPNRPAYVRSFFEPVPARSQSAQAETPAGGAQS